MGNNMRGKNPWWLYLSTIITGIIAVGLYLMKLPFFSLPFVGLALWQVQKILSRRLDEYDYDREVKKQNQLIQKTAKEALILKPAIIQEIRKSVQELWERADWLARNFKVLWPGGNKSEERKEEYLAKLEAFDGYITKESITLSKAILEPAQEIYWAINEYRTGKDLRWTPPYDRESSLEGGKMMSSGAKKLRKAFDDLYHAIREAIINPELLKPANDKS